MSTNVVAILNNCIQLTSLSHCCNKNLLFINGLYQTSFDFLFGVTGNTTHKMGYIMFFY